MKDAERSLRRKGVWRSTCGLCLAMMLVGLLPALARSRAAQPFPERLPIPAEPLSQPPK